jgi:hypothetical protein
MSHVVRIRPLAPAPSSYTPANTNARVGGGVLVTVEMAGCQWS